MPSVDESLPLLAEGKMVIPANIHHTSIDPNGVGGMLGCAKQDCKTTILNEEGYEGSICSVQNQSWISVMVTRSH